MAEQSGNMKMRVARALKWNLVDKVATQILYAVTGIILARVLSEADFGLIGAILVFQAFASMFVDSGFSYALIQRKNPTDRDYSTVLWFNIGVASLLYVLLFFCAPLIADCFQGDTRLIPLSRVMFLTFILNALAIVQTNRLMKRMDVRMIAVSNSLGLIGGGAVGIVMALTGFGPWALVWQAIVVAAVKTLVLWVTSSWRPLAVFSWSALRSFFNVGSGAMITSFLNTLFQNIYSFFIGNRVGLAPLGYYTQADKWSKMGISSMSAILTSSFLPALSDYQDDPAKFASATAKMNRFTSYLLFPATALLIVTAAPVFHCLFGTKWDPSIILFQLLLVRGVFTVLNSLYSSYVIALGRPKMMVCTEILRDGTALLAILVTLPYIAIVRPDNLTYGVAIFLWGQVIASAIAWLVMLIITARISWRTPWQFLMDCLPYFVMSTAIAAAVIPLAAVISNPWLQLLAMGSAGLGAYLAVNAILGSAMQRDLFTYLRAHFRKQAPEGSSEKNPSA